MEAVHVCGQSRAAVDRVYFFFFFFLKICFEITFHYYFLISKVGWK